MNQSRTTERPLKNPQVLSLVEPTSSFILDVACGDGKMASDIKQRLKAEVWGVEANQKLALAATANCDKVLLGRIEDASPELPNNYFDTIILANVLEYVQDPYAVLAGIKPKLSPTGEIIASIPNSRHWSVLKKLIEDDEIVRNGGGAPNTPLSLFTFRGILEMFAKTGYEVIDMKGHVSDEGGIPRNVLSAFHEAGLNVGRLREEGSLDEFFVKVRKSSSNVNVNETDSRKTQGSTENPKGSFLTSIVIPVYNQQEYTEITLESIRRFTSVPYEIIVVDNASDEKTKRFLESQHDITLIRNEGNLGFPRACNQGIGAASGKYVVLLNSDVFVTEEWLSGLLECAEGSDSIGIVGPMTNYISGPQMERNIPYTDIAELPAFAREYRQANRRKWVEFPRVAGFCMLIKRQVVEKIGGLDTLFGIGNCEDDDYCLRAKLSGFKVALAGDVFIHHFGSKSFTQKGLERYLNTVHSNEKLFEEKWGVTPSDWWRDGKSPTKGSELFIPLSTSEPVTVSAAK